MTTASTAGMEPLRVLVVEDDPAIADSLVRGLRQVGYGAEGVSTGRAALAQPPPDVVLLDLGLPDMDGVEVCRRLRLRSDAAIIVVTAPPRWLAGGCAHGWKATRSPPRMKFAAPEEHQYS